MKDGELFKIFFFYTFIGHSHCLVSSSHTNIFRCRRRVAAAAAAVVQCIRTHWQQSVSCRFSPTSLFLASSSLFATVVWNCSSCALARCRSYECCVAAACRKSSCQSAMCVCAAYILLHQTVADFVGAVKRRHLADSVYYYCCCCCFC